MKVKNKKGSETTNQGLKLFMVLLVAIIAIEIIVWIVGCAGIFWAVLLMILIAFLGWLSAKEKNRYHKVDVGPKLPDVSQAQATMAVAQHLREQEEEKRKYYEAIDRKKESDLLAGIENIVDHLQRNRGVWFTQQDILAVKSLTKNKGATKKIKDIFQFYRERGCTTTGVNSHIEVNDCGELKIRYV